ncbi:MAG: hypothetical protein NT131_04935 [Methanomassiliicoccales archaeon]|nr:hypothetical protein [Methanomassiliicoccales archaeon]
MSNPDIRLGKYQSPFNMPDEKPNSDAAIESIIEGKKMEAYAEHRTKDMHACTLCGAIGYRKRPMRPVGHRWICIDCLRSLKETLEGLDQWEAEIQLEKEMSKKIDETLRT